MHSLHFCNSEIQHPSYLLLTLQYPEKTHQGESEFWNQRSKFRNSTWTLQRHRPILRWAISYSDWSIHYTQTNTLQTHSSSLKQTFRQEIEKMLTARVIKPVHEVTPWINSFILIESTDKSTGKPKLWICLDLTNLNKVIIHEPYCFQTPEDIAHQASWCNCHNSTWMLQGILASMTQWQIKLPNHFQHRNRSI